MVHLRRLIYLFKIQYISTLIITPYQLKVECGAGWGGGGSTIWHRILKAFDPDHLRKKLLSKLWGHSEICKGWCAGNSAWRNEGSSERQRQSFRVMVKAQWPFFCLCIPITIRSWALCHHLPLWWYMVLTSPGPGNHESKPQQSQAKMNLFSL